MTIVTPSDVHLDFEELADEALDLAEPIFVRRPGKEGVAIIAEAELRSLIETAHLFGTRANARRILEALDSADRGDGKAMTLEELRRELGLGDGER
ncbi:MAG TPA: type II toxin-antitoxin system Phd/YefM family antitoxin [Thermoanaerobaculia bacterium]|jgi:antitoxin YefM|nr:type II toxin-antitoxin system Phd/YefM family antitoxin [Thermoanaerobaculia bacterium]